MHTIDIHLWYLVVILVISVSLPICTLPFFALKCTQSLGFEAIEATAFAWVWSVCDQPIAVGISFKSSKMVSIWRS